MPTTPLYNSTTGMIATPTATTTLAQQTAAQQSGFNSFITPTQNPSPISVSTLTTPSPTQPLPQTQTTPTTTNLGISTNSALSGISTDASYTPPVNDARQETQNSLKSLLTKITSQTGEVNAIQNDPALIDKKNKALAISNEMDQLDKGFRDEVKQIKETFQGSPAGLQDVLSHAQDRYQNTRANIALTYKVAVQDYQGAEEIANQKVQSLKDTNTQALQAYNLYANFFNNDLTESEKMQVQANITRKENASKALEDAYSNALKNAYQNGAPSSVLSALDTAARAPGATISSIYGAAGKYAAEPVATQVVEIGGRKVLIDKQGNTIKDLGRSDAPTVYDSIDLKSYSKDGQDLLGVAQNLASKFENKFTQTQFMSNVQRLAKTGDQKQLADYIFSEAISNIKDTDTRKKAFGNYRVVKQLSNLESQLDAYYANGGKTDIFRGTKEDMLARVGFVQNTKLREIGTSISNTLDELARARTGAVISKDEEKLYASILPGTNKTADLNKAIIQGLNSSLSTDIDSILQFQLTGSGFDTISKYLKPQGSYSSIGTDQTTTPPQTPITSQDNSIFNSVIVPKAITTTSTTTKPTTGGFSWPSFPSFNFGRFFK